MDSGKRSSNGSRPGTTRNAATPASETSHQSSSRTPITPLSRHNSTHNPCPPNRVQLRKASTRPGRNGLNSQLHARALRMLSGAPIEARDDAVRRQGFRRVRDPRPDHREVQNQPMRAQRLAGSAPGCPRRDRRRLGRHTYARVPSPAQRKEGAAAAVATRSSSRSRPATPARPRGPRRRTVGVFRSSRDRSRTRVERGASSTRGRPSMPSR